MGKFVKFYHGIKVHSKYPFDTWATIKIDQKPTQKLKFDSRTIEYSPVLPLPALFGRRLILVISWPTFTYNPSNMEIHKNLLSLNINWFMFHLSIFNIQKVESFYKCPVFFRLPCVSSWLNLELI